MSVSDTDWDIFVTESSFNVEALPNMPLEAHEMLDGVAPR